MLAIRLCGIILHTCTFQNPTHNQDAQPSVPLVTSDMPYPYIFALVQSSKKKLEDGAIYSFYLFIFLSASLSPHFNLLDGSSNSSSFAPHILLLLSNRFLTLNLSLTSPFLVSPQRTPSSDFNFSLSSLCSSLTPSGERPIRLHRGFTGHGCEGKPKWNAAHLLEWNQHGFSSITPYASLSPLLLQLHWTKKAR